MAKKYEDFFDEDFDIDNVEYLNKKIARNINLVHKDKLSVAEVLSDFIVEFMGKWTFIFGFIAFVALWEGYNIFSHKPFDPYPFILLTGYLSVFVIPQGSIILMSQRRQDEKDRLRDEMDYRVNVKNEIMIEEILKRLDRIEGNHTLERELWENRGE